MAILKESTIRNSDQNFQSVVYFLGISLTANFCLRDGLFIRPSRVGYLCVMDISISFSHPSD